MFCGTGERDVFRAGMIEGAQLAGKLGMPQLKPTDAIPRNLTPFNKAITEPERGQKWVHFFIDDYQFERIWNAPQRYLPLLRQFEGVVSTDYSMLVGMPEAQQIWNCYRNRAVACWMQREGIAVIPTASWSTPESYGWCFDGLPQGGTIAISTNGCLKNKRSEYYFQQGYARLLQACKPDRVILYGRMPKNFGDSRIIQMDSYSQEMKRRIK